MLFATIYCFAMGQGPNRTFGKFKKQKGELELVCSEDCATVVLIYEKGTYINNVKAAIGFDHKYAVASDKANYIVFSIKPGIHTVSLPHGVNGAKDSYTVEPCQSEFQGFQGLCSMFSDIENYTISLGEDVTELEYNLSDVPYTNKMFAAQINYLTYQRDFKAGQTYYYKTFKIGNGLSLACGPLITETTKEDFEKLIAGKTIKGEGEAFFYMDN